MLILCVGGTLAYIIANLQDSAKRNASVTSDAVDILKFEIDKDISLNPTQFNVVEGGDNLQDTAVGSAILRANSTDNNATYNYYVYFQINSNNYIYTTTEQTPEIVLTIINPEGSPITNIDGLDYVTSGGVSGFDITTKSGLYEVTELYEIISTSSTDDTIQEWEFTVSFINLDTNQAENGGKKLEAEIILSRKPVYTLSSYITDELYTGIDGENGLYYHDGTGTYGTLEAGDNSYRFAGGDYEIAEAYQSTYNQIYGEIIKRYCNGVEDTSFMEICSGNLYYMLAYDNNNTQYTTINDALDQAVNDGYLTGDNIKNYVCFGSDASACPSDNLYRIIGVFDGQVKLIKADYATVDELGTNVDYGYDISTSLFCLIYKGQLTAISLYYWNNDTQTNIWSESNLNKTNLNSNFLNSFDSVWQEMIATTKWKVGGMGYDANESSFKIAHDYEINNPNSDVETTYSAKIGLMYVSDYVYASQPEDWNTTIDNYVEIDNANPNNNWMYMGTYEWTVSRHSDSGDAWLVSIIGSLSYGSVDDTSGFPVRPSFSLSSSVMYSEGDGSIENPFRIKV